MKTFSRVVFVLTAVAGAWAATLVGFAVKREIEIYQAERDLLQAKVESLSRLANHADRRMQLIEALVAVPEYRDRLDKRLPAVANKLIELTLRHESDGLQLPLLLAIVETESSFTPSATSKVVVEGIEVPVAFGIMQVTRSTAKPYLHELGHEWSPHVMYNPEIGLEVGVAYLVDLHRGYVADGLETLDNWKWTVASYYAGPAFLQAKEKDWSYWRRVESARQRWIEKGVL